MESLWWCVGIWRIKHPNEWIAVACNWAEFKWQQGRTKEYLLRSVLALVSFEHLIGFSFKHLLLSPAVWLESKLMEYIRELWTVMFWLRKTGLKQSWGRVSREALRGRESVRSWLQPVHLPGLRDILLWALLAVRSVPVVLSVPNKLCLLMFTSFSVLCLFPCFPSAHKQTYCSCHFDSIPDIELWM